MGRPLRAATLAAGTAMAAISLVANTAQNAPEWRPEGPPLASATDISRSPLRPDTLYLATQSGGIYRSDDDGRRWTLPGDELTSRSIRWVEADPSSPDTVWAGENDPGNPAVWRSLDRGATWKLLTPSYKGELATLHPVGWPIAFAPSKPTDIWIPSTSLNYRSRDGGRTWTDFRVPNQDVYLIAVHPRNPDVVWAAGSGQDHHLSRTDDGGRTWKPIGKGLGQRLTVLTTDGGAEPVLYAATGFNTLFRSSDNGETFTQIPSPVSGTQDILRLKFAGLSSSRWMTTESGLFKSGDGQQWTRADRGTGRYLVTGLAFDPRDPNAVVAAVSGAGVYRSVDGGNTWAVSNAGVEAGWIEKLYAQPGVATVIAQTSVGTFVRDRSGAWTELGAPFVTGDKEVELDGFVFEGRSGVVWAHETADLWRSVDGGLKFAPMDYKKSMTSVDGVSFRSLAQHPTNPKVMWAGTWTGRSAGTSVYKSTDGGREWRRSGQGLPTEAVTLLRSGGPDHVIALSGRRALYATSDGGESWTAIGRGLPDADVLQLVIDPSELSRVFVVAGQSLFVSTDRGASFAKIGGPLEKERVRAVGIAPDGLLFAGSFRGIVASPDGGTTWTPLTGTLPNTDVRAIAVGGSPDPRLWIGLAGGSVWSAPLPKR